jgi:hypothetical protein
VINFFSVGVCVEIVVNLLRPVKGGNFEYAYRFLFFIASRADVKVKLLICSANLDRMDFELDNIEVVRCVARSGIVRQLISEFLIVRKMMKLNPEYILFSPCTQIPFTVFPGRQYCVVHDLNFKDLEMSLSKIIYKYLLCSFCALFADGIIFISNFTRDNFLNLISAKLRKVNYRVIYNGFDRSLLERELICLRDRDDVVIIFGHRAHKNVEGAIKFVRTLNLKGHSLISLVVGSGENISHLKEVYTSSDDVEFSGFLRTSELNEKLSRAKFLCFLSHYEGFGLPVFESFALGTLAVISPQKALLEVANENAVVAPAVCMDAAVLYVDRLLRSPEQYKEKVVSARSYVSQYKWEKTFSEILDFIGS